RKSRKRRRSTRLMSRTASARARCVSAAALAAAFALAAAAQPVTTAAPKPPPVTLADATNAALQQVSAFQQAQIEESLAAEELRRRALVRGVAEAGYGAALATGKREAAEQSLAAAEEFRRVTCLNYDAGEVPEVDCIRARLQSAARRDDLLQAREQEAIANAG